MNQAQSITFSITGVSPLLMHSPRLSIPTDPLYKEFKKISGKRQKTDSDLEELSKLEWYAGLYIQDGAPCLPAEAIEAMMIEAARKSRKGLSAKAGLFVSDNAPLIYDGPKDPNELWGMPEFILTTGVRVQKARINRSRPIFKQWSAKVTVHFLPDVLNLSEVKEFMNTAGGLIGLLDWRPKFGRFTANVV